VDLALSDGQQLGVVHVLQQEGDQPAINARDVKHIREERRRDPQRDVRCGRNE
jgi:hypothetical protein